MTAPAGTTPQERIASLEASHEQLARRVADLAGNVDRFITSTQDGFDRLSTAIAQVERNVGGEIARINRPDWPRIGVTFAIITAVLSAVMSPILVRQTAIETWGQAVDARVQRDHDALIAARIDAAVIKDRLERGAVR